MRTTTKRDRRASASPAPAPADEGPEITVEAFVQRKGRGDLVRAFAHCERLDHKSTRKFAFPKWEKLFAEFVSAPRG